MELLVTQPGFKYCSDHLDIRKPEVRKLLGLHQWEDLYNGKNDERIVAYLKKIQSGKIGVFNPNPMGDYYRPITNRIIFKFLNFGNDRINWMRDTFGVKVIFSIRHPLAVAISQKKLPRLPAFISTKYIERFSPEQKKLSLSILENGSHNEKAVLAWCLQNVPPIQDKQDDWVFITYEQLIAEPAKVINELTQKLDLVKTDVIYQNLTKQSMVKNMSDQATKEILEQGEAERDRLLSKWRKKIGHQEEAALFKIIEAFDLDIYTFGNNLPNEKYLIQ